MILGKHIQYGKYVIVHKWYVLIECFKMRLFWRGIVHDLDKFKPKQWKAYANHFHEKDGTRKVVRNKIGYYKPFDTGDIDFDLAIKSHSQKNTHHWQYWCFPKDKTGLRTFEIPDNDIKEMICDWIGAGHAQKIDNWQDPIPWWRANINKMQLEAHSILKIESVLRLLRFNIKVKGIKI